MHLSSLVLFKTLYDIPTTFLIKCSKHDSRKYFNQSQPSVAFHIETSHLIYMAGFYIKSISELKLVISTCQILINGNFENIQNILNSLMDESLYFAHTRNHKKEIIYYIQETKTIFQKFFALIYNGFSHFCGKKKLNKF